MYIHVLSLVLVQILLKPVDVASVNRNKRVLFGLAGYKEDRDRYPSFRYYVFLAQGAALDKLPETDWIGYMLGLTSPNPTDLVCGGSLLTPSVVQTACHCISHIYVAKWGDNVSRALSKNVWENRIYSYFGSNLVTDMWGMLRPRHYLTYAKCRKLEGVAQYNMFDYGLIVSEDTVPGQNSYAKISYAPAYPVKDLLQFYYDALQKEFMCLLIGHGPHQTEYEDDGDIIVDNEPSLEIRWGWRTVMNYMDCLTVSYTPRDRRTFYYNYTRDASWVCAQSYNPGYWPEHYVNTRGDSGGPMTCNNVYFSVFSMTTAIKFTNIISYSGPIVNTHFENAAEYRSILLWFVKNFRNPDATHPHPEDMRYTPTPPFRYPDAHSSGPDRISSLTLSTALLIAFKTSISPSTIYRNDQ